MLYLKPCLLGTALCLSFKVLKKFSEWVLKKTRSSPHFANFQLRFHATALRIARARPDFGVSPLAARGQAGAGQGRAGQGQAGAVRGRAGQGRAGQGRAGQGRAGRQGGDCFKSRRPSSAGGGSVKCKLSGRLFNFAASKSP